MALKNYLDYDGLLYWKQKIQAWVSAKFALKTDIPTTLPADGGNADTVADILLLVMFLPMPNSQIQFTLIQIIIQHQ